MSKLLANKFLLVFLLIAGLSVWFVDYAFLKLLVWLGLALIVSFFSQRLVFLVLALVGVLEAVVGFLQFLWQRSLGLKFLGESVFGG